MVAWVGSHRTPSEARHLFGGLAAIVLVGVAAGSAGCFKTAEFACTSDADCVRSGIQGTCEAVGYCSFPDPGCADGRRYGDYSGPFTGQCVSGSGSDGRVPVPTMIGGTVSGLVDSAGLVLRDNGADDLAVATSGAFTFQTPVFTGFPYAVVVGSQPSNPAQTCTVANGVGLAGTVDVTNIDITCATAAYTVGGTVTGLNAGNSVVLADNGGNATTVSANGGFTFSTPVASGSMYTVAIQTQPAGQTCNVSGATGTVGTGNVTSVVVNCATGTHTIGGMVSGLIGTVVLLDNGGDNLTLNANGSFAFATPLATNATYSVTVFTQPTYPPYSQTCVVAMGSGTVAAANVTTVAVTCTINKFTIGGTVSGLTGTLVLRDNGGDDKTLTANTAYTFATSIASGMTYAATVYTNPTNQICTLSGATGTVMSANVTNVNAPCATMGTDQGVLCGASFCAPATDACCVLSPPSCTAAGGTCSNGSSKFRCDDTADCVAIGSPSTDVCCEPLKSSGDHLKDTACESFAACSANAMYLVLCDPTVATPCPNGGTCQPITAYPSLAPYYACQ